jgi:hypothetical protein
VTAQQFDGKKFRLLVWIMRVQARSRLEFGDAQCLKN